MNEIWTRKTMENKTRSWLFENINKIDKTFLRRTRLQASHFLVSNYTTKL